MLIFFSGEKEGKRETNNWVRNLKKAYQDYLFPGLVLFLCLISVYMVSNMLNAKSVFGGGTEKYIVIIIDDYGYNGEGTEEMLKLGIPITAAVMPGMESSEADAEKYHEAGYDVILHQPMEPHKGMASWLGSYGITSGMSDEQVGQNVKDALASVKYAVGINNHMGSKVMENERIVSQLMKIAGEMDLIFVDNKTTFKSSAPGLAEKQGVRFYERDIFLDTVKTAENAKKQLLKAAEIADKKGYAIVIGHVGSSGGKTTVQGINEALPELLGKGYKFITISDLDLRMSMGFEKN